MGRSDLATRVLNPGQQEVHSFRRVYCIQLAEFFASTLFPCEPI